MSSKTSKIMHENNEHLPFQMTYLPDFVLKKLKEELKETPETKLKNLQELRKRLKDEKSTSEFDFHEDFLVQFLRHSKHDTAKAFGRVQNMIHLRRKNPDIFGTVPDDYFLTKESTKTFIILPKRCRDGCTIVLFRLATIVPDEMSADELIRMGFLFLSQMYRDPMTQINGVKVIYDFQGASFQLLKKFSPYKLYIVNHFAMQCVPARYKVFHIINKSFLVKHIWTCMKPFLSEKQRNRVFFHSDVDELLDYFPRSLLPVEYGGDLKETIDEYWYRNANKEHESHGVTGQANYF